MKKSLDMSKLTGGNRHQRRAAAAGASVPPGMMVDGKPVVSIPGVLPTWTCTVGIPSGTMMHTDFAMALVAMCSRTPGRLAMCNTKSSVIAKSRNVCVENAIALGTTHLLFLDSDMIFPQDTLLRLIAWEKDIVGGTYVQRTPPHRILGSRLGDETDIPQSGLIEMGEMPTGCLLIKTSVFEKFTRPYFRFGVDEEKGELVGEDLLFTRQAVEKGFKIYCDMGLSRQLYHIGEHAFSIGEIETIPVEIRREMVERATAPTVRYPEPAA